MEIMLHIKEVIVVEGRYDKNTLSQCVDAVIVETEGFGIFRDKEKLALLRRCAEKRGLIVLTDSDGAGFLIRNRIRSAIDPALVKHAYIPDVPGKERRKKVGSKEGTLGVEGMSGEVLIEALLRAGATTEEGESGGNGERITKADLAALGLSGSADATSRRAALQKAWRLPARHSPNALLDALNARMTREEFLTSAAALLQQIAPQTPQQED